MKVRLIMSSEQGSILVWITLMSVLLLVFLAFAFDGGYFYQQKRRMQTAADSAALAGALERKRNVGSTDWVTIGQQEAAKNGFTHGSSNITVTINEPPSSGAYAGTAGYVEAIIAQQHQTFFASLFNLLTPGGNYNQATIRARAVAGNASSNCIYVMHENANRAFEIASGSTLNAGCGVQVNSNHSTAVSITSGSHLNATDINIKGNYEATSGSTASPTPDLNEPVVPDPLKWLVAPTFGSCAATDLEVGKNGTETRTIGPGTYCGGIWVTNNSTLILDPGGEYLLKGNSNRGGLRIMSGSRIQGNGVFFYNGNLTACSDPDKCKISFESTSIAQLSAMSTGYYAGILFFQERVLTDEPKLTVSIESGSNSFFHGTLYIPNHKLRYNSYANSSSAAPWTAVVARTFEISSNTTVAINFNSSSIPSPVRRIALVE